MQVKLDLAKGKLAERKIAKLECLLMKLKMYPEN